MAGRRSFNVRSRHCSRSARQVPTGSTESADPTPHRAASSSPLVAPGRQLGTPSTGASSGLTPEVLSVTNGSEGKKELTGEWEIRTAGSNLAQFSGDRNELAVGQVRQNALVLLKQAQPPG